MKYLCLVYFEGTIFDAMTESEKATLNHDSWAYDQALMANGSYIAAEALQSPQTAATVRVRQGQTLLTDGPFAETKEQLGGFILVDAPDREAALQIAAGISIIKDCWDEFPSLWGARSCDRSPADRYH